MEPTAEGIFQSTLPRGERPSRPPDGSRSNDFNPRSHEGSDCHQIGAVCNLYAISIHAPTRGATRCSYSRKQRKVYFNPRSHEGSDGAGSDRHYLHGISIHAPTRGATEVDRRVYPHLFRFQSTLPRGERLVMWAMETFDGQFQSTLPRGERQVDAAALNIFVLFPKISIHAPTRGATWQRNIISAM